MAFGENLLVVSIITFLVLVVWAKAMRKDIIEVLYDIKEFLSSFGGAKEE